MSSTLSVQVDGPRTDLTAAADQEVGLGHSGSTSVYGQFSNSWFQGGLPTPPRTKDMTGLSISSSKLSYSSTHLQNGRYPAEQRSSSHTRVPSDPYGMKYVPRQNPAVEARRSDQSQTNAIVSHLQIPESVNSSKGSLAEFAAEITCLFWFETAETLDFAANLPADALPDRGLVPDATPSLGFTKWVTTMLSTTQVGKNVILLALMFVYRLKKFNPSVSGKRGSEFRLLTIALMLGNKFLDDNTYTNKTWAEVSGISVSEIHIMEVEFLSNMRYELYASEQDWEDWETLLGKFGSFYKKATRFVGQSSPQSNPPVTPTNQTFGYKLPSPPSKHNGSLQASYNLPNPMTTLPQLPRSPARMPSHSSALFERKRSLDSSDLLPPAKRLYQPQSMSHTASPATFVGRATITPDSCFSEPGMKPDLFTGSRVPQLPAPRLTTPTYGVNTHLAPLSLPPAKSIGPVYPHVSSGWSQPITPVSAMPTNMNGSYVVAPSPMANTVGTQGGVVSAHTSPVNFFGSVTPNKPGLSPSYFLTNRSSPYRPVRHVNTLLNPPPSTTTQTSVKNIGFDQMHYQPLGRPMTERRSGPVPYLYADGRPPSNVALSHSSQYPPF